MTKKLFDLDSYVKSCTATVLSCEEAKKNSFAGFAVELDETCFFPEGGGQPADVGTLRCGEQTANVLYTYEQGDQIFHLCDRPLPVGETADGQIDFEKRFANMQIHSGEHILSGVIFTELGLHNVGFHMGHEVNTIDLDGELSPATARQIEEKVNRILYENRPVFVGYPDAEALRKLPLRKKPEVEHLRVVEVQDCDWCGCCGTHVAHTGEIGLLKITDTQRYKGGTRVSFLCGAAALRFDRRPLPGDQIGLRRPLLQAAGGSGQRRKAQSRACREKADARRQEPPALLAAGQRPCRQGRTVWQ